MGFRCVFFPCPPKLSALKAEAQEVFGDSRKYYKSMTGRLGNFGDLKKESQVKTSDRSPHVKDFPGLPPPLKQWLTQFR